LYRAKRFVNSKQAKARIGGSRCHLVSNYSVLNGGKRRAYNQTQYARYESSRRPRFTARHSVQRASDNAGKQSGILLTARREIDDLRLNHALAVFVCLCFVSPEEPAAAEISLTIASAASRGLLAAVIGRPTTR
jgi:hypothetical protein